MIQKITLFICTVIVLAGSMSAQTTPNVFIQIINNSTDPVLNEMDLYLNGAKVVDNISSPGAYNLPGFVAPAALQMGFAPGNSLTANDTLLQSNQGFATAGKYVLIVTGLSSTTGYATNPNAVPIDLALVRIDNTPSQSQNAGNVDFKFVHGTTDAPTVDLLSGAAVLVNDVDYKDISSLVALNAQDTCFDITLGNDHDSIIRRFNADISGWAGDYVTLLSTGFADSTQNGNGPGIGLFAVDTGATVTVLPSKAVVPDGIDENGSFGEVNVYPNPAGDQIRILLDLPVSRNVKVELADMKGHILLARPSTTMPSGKHTLAMDTHDLPAGIYELVITAGVDQVVRSISIIR